MLWCHSKTCSTLFIIANVHEMVISSMKLIVSVCLILWWKAMFLPTEKQTDPLGNIEWLDMFENMRTNDCRGLKIV